MGTRADIFSQTLEGLEAGLTVELIATFDVARIAAAADPAAFLADPALAALDAFPVERDGTTIGVLERGHRMAGPTAADAMIPLDATMLVPATMPIGELLASLRQGRPYRLVLTGRGISGIVTRSDLGKLPVRLYAYSVISHLETVMATFIVQAAPDDDWLRLLTGNRSADLVAKHARLSSDRVDLARIECTDLGDKIVLVRKLTGTSDRRAKRELEPIEKLRNRVMHSGVIAETWEEVQGVIDTLASARAWIATLEDHMHRDIG